MADHDRRDALEGELTAHDADDAPEPTLPLTAVRRPRDDSLTRTTDDAPPIIANVPTAPTSSALNTYRRREGGLPAAIGGRPASDVVDPDEETAHARPLVDASFIELAHAGESLRDPASVDAPLPRATPPRDMRPPILSIPDADTAADPSLDSLDTITAREAPLRSNTSAIVPPDFESTHNLSHDLASAQAALAGFAATPARLDEPTFGELQGRAPRVRAELTDQAPLIIAEQTDPRATPPASATRPLVATPGAARPIIAAASSATRPLVAAMADSGTARPPPNRPPPMDDTMPMMVPPAVAAMSTQPLAAAAPAPTARPAAALPVVALPAAALPVVARPAASPRPPAAAAPTTPNARARARRWDPVTIAAAIMVAIAVGLVIAVRFIH